MPNNNVIVTAKPSLLSTFNPSSLENMKPNNLYTGYIDRGAKKGLLVKFNESIKFFIGKESLNESSYNTYDSVLVLVKSITEGKINASL